MTDGTFEYSLTLPKPKNQENVQVKFAEDVAGLANAETVASGDVTTKTDSVSAELDHFTIFITVIVESGASIDVTKIERGAINPTMNVTLAGDTFVGTIDSPNTGSWTISSGTTTLHDPVVTITSSTTATVAFTGTTALGSISIKANSAAVTLGGDINAVIVDVADTIAPVLQTVVHNTTDKTITLTWNEAVHYTTENDSPTYNVDTPVTPSMLNIFEATANGSDWDYSLSTIAPHATIDTTTFNAEKTILTVHYTGTLVEQIDKHYVVDSWTSVGGWDVRDLAGNPDNLQTIQNGTPVYPIAFAVTADTIAPTESSVILNQTAKTVTTIFSEPVQLKNGSTVTAYGDVTKNDLGIYKLTGTMTWENAAVGGVEVSAVHFSDATHLTVTYTGTLPVGIYIVDTFGADVTDLAGNKLTDAGALTFEVTDATLPTATVTHVDSTKTIVYTFNEPVQLINEGSLVVTAASAITPSMLGIHAVVMPGMTWDSTVKVDTILSASFDGTGKILTIVYTGTLPTGSYVVDTYGYSVTDLAGNEIVDDPSLIFAADSTAPAGGLLTVLTTNHPTPGITVDTPTAGVYAITPALTGSDQLTSLTVVVTDADLNKTAVPAYIDGGGTANGTMVWSSGSVWTWTPGSAVNFTEGEHYLTATFADNAGNTTLLRANFTTDKTAPVITRLGTSPLNVIYGSTYTDSGATANDTLDANITENIVTVNPVNTAIPGDYTITYNVVDGAGNHALEVSRIVHVIKANADCTSIIGYDDVYDGSAHGASGTCEGVGSDGTLAGLNLGASFTDVPGGTANWTFTDTTGNYNNASGSVDISIGQTEPDEDGNATLNNSNPQVVLTDGEQSVTIKVTPGTESPTIDVSALLTGTLPEITINTEVAEVFIPAGTVVTGPAGWDGVINAPTAGTPSGGNAPAGFAVGETVITLGSASGMLLFNPAVVITLPGVTGAVGYRPAGSNQWIEITNVCTGNYDDPTGAPAGGECAINDGVDTKILTYHFTSFGDLLDTRAPETVDNFKGVYRPITGDVELTWDINDSDTSKVLIYRGTTYHYTLNSHSHLNTQDRRDENYIDKDVTPGKTYYYRIITKDEAGNKSDVKVIKITIPINGSVAISTPEPTEPAPTGATIQEETTTTGGSGTSVTGGMSGSDQGSSTKGSVLGETTDQGNGNQQPGFWASNWKWFLALIFAGGGFFFWLRRRQGGGNVVG